MGKKTNNDPLIWIKQPWIKRSAIAEMLYGESTTSTRNNFNKRLFNKKNNFGIEWKFTDEELQKLDEIKKAIREEFF